MPTYTIDGKKFTSSTPLSAEELDEIASSMAPAPEQRSIGQELGRQVGLTTRAGVTGFMSPLPWVADPLASIS